MKERQKPFAGWKPRLCAAALLLAALAVMAALGALRARQIARAALDGRRERAQAQERATEFSLRAQMRREQEAVRVNGWLSAVDGERATLKGPRGELVAQAYAPIGGGEGAPWVILVHGGPGTSGAQMLDAACELSLAGYNVLLPDLYAHGQSGGVVSTLGVRDAQDVRAWVDWLLAREPQARVALLGQDEGALAVLLAAADGLPEAVAAVALDGVFLDAPKRALQLAGEAGLGGALDALTLRAALFALGVRLTREDALAAAARCEVPLLFIHGTLDGDVSPVDSEDAAHAAQDARLLLVEGASHGMARYVDPQGYYGAVRALFDAATGKK